MPSRSCRMFSGKEPLDRAAISRFARHLPLSRCLPRFNGPFIELRFIFLYNLPLTTPSETLVKPREAQAFGSLFLGALFLLYLLIRYWKLI